MYWKRILLLCMAMHGAMYGYAQLCSYSFEGQVVDEQGGPVIGASVFIPALQTGQATDSIGRFFIKNLCAGKYSVKIQSLGFEDLFIEVNVQSNLTKRIVLQEVVAQLKEILIQHHDDAHTEHATNFVKVDERQLTRLAGKTLGEALKGVSGVNTLQTGPGISKPVLHGVHSQRILILNNGLRHEGQQWGAEHAPEIDPFIASNIVIIKDASAIKYGTDALGGVIVVNPPAFPARPEVSGVIHSVFQSNGRSATVSGMLEGGLQKHKGWGWRIQGTGKKTGDFHAPHYLLTNTAINERNFSASAGYHRKKIGYDLFLSTFKTNIGILKGTSIDFVDAIERDTPAYTEEFSYKIAQPRQQVSHNLIKLNGHMRTSGGELRMQYGFQNNNRREFDIRKGDLSEVPITNLQINTHTLDVEWETVHSDVRTFSAGVNTTYQQNNNLPGIQRIPFIPNFTNQSGGIFAVYKLFRNQWTIDAGLRYDVKNYAVAGYDFKNTLYKSDLGFNGFSGSIGVKNIINEHHTGSFSLASTWRAPHVAELYSIGVHQSAAAIEYGLLLNDSTNAVMDIRQRGFENEQAVKGVASYYYTDDHLLIEIGAYANYILNYIYLRPSGVTSGFRGQNIPYFRYRQTDAFFTGVDVSATYKISQSFCMASQIFLLKAEDQIQNDFFLFIPSNRYNLTMRYEKASVKNLRNVFVESGGRYAARQNNAPVKVNLRELIATGNMEVFESGESSIDFLAPPEGYFLLDLSVGFSVKPAKVQYEFRMACENLLNTAYRDYTNRLRYYSDDLGRNIVLSIKCIF